MARRVTSLGRQVISLVSPCWFLTVLKKVTARVPDRRASRPPEYKQRWVGTGFKLDVTLDDVLSLSVLQICKGLKSREPQGVVTN